jgi:hypothetical protein
MSAIGTRVRVENGSKGFAGRSLILKRGLRRPLFGLAEGLGDRGNRLARHLIGSGLAVGEL